MRFKIQILAGLWLLSVCVSVWGMGGRGTEADPYVITNVFELQDVQNDLGAYYVLGNNIDANGTQSWNIGAGFEPIGNDANHFTGVFDGRGHVIKGLYINKPDTDYVGLFGYISGGEVKNVGLSKADVTASRNGGLLVGANNGATVSNSWSSGTVRGSYIGQIRLGGLMGVSSGADTYVSRCFSSATVIARGGDQVGGLVGYNGHGSVISDCFATGEVIGSSKVGGLVGDNMVGEAGTLVERCYSTGLVAGGGGAAPSYQATTAGGGGGLVGFNWRNGITTNSYWDVETSGKTLSYGGVGKSTAEMMQQATFTTWDFNDVWGISEGLSYPFLLWSVKEQSACKRAMLIIEDVLVEKAAVLEKVNVVVAKERAAHNVLGELLKSGDYGGLAKSDVIMAMKQVNKAMQSEKQSLQFLESGTKNLKDSLVLLTWDPNLIAHWKFDEGGGSVAYDSAGGSNGTVYGAMWVRGLINGALSFDGESDYVDCRKSFSPVTSSTTKTIMAWAKPDTAGMGARLFTLYRRSDYYVAFSLYSRIVGDDPATWTGVYATAGNGYNILDSGLTVDTGVWTHVALVQNGTDVHIYVNGELRNSASDATAPVISIPPNATIGAYKWFNDLSAPFNGKIDDVRLYNRALSAAEILRLYNEGK